MIVPVQDKVFKQIYIALFFLFVGVLSSPTIIAGYQIFMIIPALYLILKSPKLKLSLSSKILILFIIWTFISTFYNYDSLVNPSKSIQKLRYFLSAILFLWPIKYFWERKKEFQVFKLTSLLSIITILAVPYGLIEIIHHFDYTLFNVDPKHDRNSGFIGYMRYGYISSFFLLLFISYKSYLDKTKKEIKFFKLGIIFTVLAIVTSQTRGGFIGLCIGLIVLYWDNIKIRKLAFGSTLSFLSVVFICTTFNIGNYRYLNLRDGSTSIRLTQYQAAVMAIKENPVMGLGSNQLSYNVKSIKQKYGIKFVNFESHAHNTFLQVGSNFGIPGLVLFISFLLAWFVEMRKMHSPVGVAVSTYIVAFCVSGQFEVLFDVANIHLLTLAYTFSQVVKNQEESARKK